MAMPMIHKILEEVCKVEKRPERIKKLSEYQNNKVLLMLLKTAFDPNIEMLLPEGEPPYEENEFPEEMGRLYQEARKFYLFLDPKCGGNADLHQIKRERIFIELLESIHPDEAKLVIHVKDKDLNKHYKGLTIGVVKKAFPGLIPD